MQGGAPNNTSPYAGYQGGYPPQAGMQGYPPQAGRGGAAGYYPQQQQPQPQQAQPHPQQQAVAPQQPHQQPQQMAAQQYAGYNQSYGQGYAPRGGYQQPQPQQGYAPRGGYYQGAAGYGAAGMQQGYPAVAAPGSRGGYGQGYYPQQQQQQPQQQGYYNQGYNAMNQYPQGGRGGFQGGAYGGQPQQPQQQQQHQQQQPSNQHFNRGFRGGRGGPGGFQRGGRGVGRGRGGRMFDSYAVVHLDSYAQLEEVGRKATTESLVPAEILATMRARARGGTIRVIVVIQKKYAAACMSIPRGPEDTLLSEKTAETFMGVPCVIVGHAERLVDLSNGAALQGPVFTTFRQLMLLLTAFDKQQATQADGETTVDVSAKTADELLEGLTKDIPTYEAVLTAMAADSAESTDLFSRLMRFDAEEEEANHEPTEVHEDGEDGEERQEAGGEENGERDESKPAVAAKPAEGTAAPKVLKRTLLSSPQGIRILRAALAVSSKRQMFFAKMVPPPANPDKNPLNHLEGSAALRLLDPLLHYPLLSDLVFQFFGVAPVGEEATKPPKAKAQEVKILCDAIARYGVLLTSSASCGNTILALLQAMDPQHAKTSVAERVAEESSKKPGLKRGRDAGESDANAEDGTQKAKTEEAATEAQPAAPATEGVGIKEAPKTLAEYKSSTAPADWQLYYAVAEAWCTGEQPVLRRKRTRFTTQAQLDADAAAAEKPATVETRLRYVSHHLLGSFVMRYMTPIFADAVLTALKSPASRKKKDHDRFVEQCETILSSLVAAWSTSEASFTRGNIYRNLLISLASRAVPGTSIDANLRTLLDNIISTIFESSREKYQSHCVQEALTVARQIKDGAQFVLRVGRAMMEKGDEAFLSLAISPSGNYVVRHLCGQLTDYATGKIAAEAEAVTEAQELEKKFFAFMAANLPKLNSIQYGRGLAAWHTEQATRLGTPAPAAAPAPAPAAAPAPAPASTTPSA